MGQRICWLKRESDVRVVEAVEADDAETSLRAGEMMSRREWSWWVSMMWTMRSRMGGSVATLARMSCLRVLKADEAKEWRVGVLLPEASARSWLHDGEAREEGCADGGRRELGSWYSR